MLGGYQPAENLNEANELVAAHSGEISGKLGLNNATFTVTAAQVQIVAGKNYWIHLTTADGNKHSVKLTVALDGAVTVTDAHQDHVAPHCHH